MEAIEANENTLELVLDELRYKIVLPNKDRDFIQKFIYENKVPYEYSMLKFMANRIETEGLFVDIGANVGNHSLYMAAATNCFAVAFEPSRALVNAIELSAKLNGLEAKLKTYCCGLSNRAGSAHFLSGAANNLGAQSLELSREGKIPVRVLDKIDLNRPISIMKVDVEGMEFLVLRGARNTIQRDRPIIFVECGTIHSFRQVYEMLTGYDYVITGTFNATPSHYFIPKERFETISAQTEMRLGEIERIYKMRQLLQKKR